MAAATSSSCTSFFNFRSNSVETRVRAAPSQGSPVCGKLDGMAMWFINGLASAFFASMERCSCIRIATQDDVGDEANEAPLILNDGNMMGHGGGSTSRRRAGKGKRRSSGAFDED
ncbi:hypothetical protein Tsubulata_037318 [Turnera subulata]|uniref:Uncharacterized protein n=1 Tax=Turnera subulata TaxID=218843 RepID=A0A9Q0JEU1_9ROSI|nr:hypothetical protein Tsubulata_037318 [Turnera subulata]